MGEKELFLRMVLAMVLGIAVLLAFEKLWLRPGPKPPAPKEEALKPMEVMPEKGPEGEMLEEVVVDTPLYRATFVPYGGRLKGFSLKRYMDKVEPHPFAKWVQGLVKKVTGKKAEYTPPRPVELVTTGEPGLLPLGTAFSGIPYDEGLPWSIEPPRPLPDGSLLLKMHWEGNGIRLEKSLRFLPKSYLIELTLRGTRPFGVGVGWIGRTDLQKSYYGFYGPVFYAHGGRTKVKPKGLKDEKEVGEVEWFAFDQDYFASVIKPEGKGLLRLGRAKEDVVYGYLFAPREGEEFRFWVFLGPKDPEELKKLSKNATKVIDYGTFGFIAVPILKLMKLTHKVTGNYGLDIVLLAFFIKLVFLYPTQKSYQAMKEMQKLAPELRLLQKKYKDDPERLRREIMELYRRRKVNPFSGCLPLLLQLPVFFALYRAFMTSIDLRHAPFVLWIRDLSSKDPTYISPLLMGFTMWLQQKLTPFQGDPQQQKLMLFMPLIFTVLFLTFPSGLVLYWLTSNVLGIVHQLWFLRR